MAAQTISEFDNRDGSGVVDLTVGEGRRVYLSIGGERAFQTGYDICDTCRYIFSKVMPAQRLTDGATAETSARLSSALRDIADMPAPATLREFGFVLPAGSYSVVLACLAASLVMPGQPDDYFAAEAVATWGVDPYFGVGHSPNTPYYRLGNEDLGDAPYGGRRLGVVLGVPLYPPTNRAMNHSDVVAEYRTLIRLGTSHPTVLALGLADDRGPATWEYREPEFARHLVVTLYVLDGHHKLGAAAAEALPVQFLIFLPHAYIGRDWRDEVSAGVDLLAARSC